MSSPDAAQDVSPSPEYSGDQNGDETMTEDQKENIVKTEGDASPSQGKSTNGSKANAKDPQRPRRKKARRACIACQRAHLTCGDERPCQRCVKRGLQDACQDGIRKKAKYLHDAPNEMLMPGVGGHYPHVNGSQVSVSTTSTAMPGTAASLAQPGAFYPPQVQPGSYEVYAQTPNQQMPPPPPSNSSFTGQPSPISPQFNPLGNQQSPQVAAIPHTQPQLNQFGGPIFDPSDPALFNFDIANLNFTNNYGALEFGMLSHMSSGAGDQAGADNNIINLQGTMITPNYTDGSNVLFPQDALMNVDWQASHPRQNSTSQVLSTPHNTPITSTIDPLRQDGANGHSNAYAIAAGPSSLASASPGSTGPDMAPQGYENSSISSPAVFSTTSQPQQAPSTPTAYNRSQTQQQQTPKLSNRQSQQQSSNAKAPVTLSAVHKQHQAQFSRKRRRPVNDIYSQVTKPYEYTARFHTLFSYFRKNMPAEKLTRIAKAIASFRPSLISLMEHLSEADLIHSEQCLMRQLLEYEDFISATGTPTILIRRTGEVVLCNKEFSILTGWRRDVLLGKEPNLNANHRNRVGNITGGSKGTPRIDPKVPPGSAGSAGSAGTGGAQDSFAGSGAATTGSTTPGRVQHVFLPELLDDDSAVQFYEDYAKLAWGDSRGKVERPMRLIKYKPAPKPDEQQQQHQLQPQQLAGGANSETIGAGLEAAEGGPVQRAVQRLENGIWSEAGICELGEQEGMVDCMCCWSVKRDMFELPMLIVLSFLPVM